jgi:hypothetical protein
LNPHFFFYGFAQKLTAALVGVYTNYALGFFPFCLRVRTTLFISMSFASVCTNFSNWLLCLVSSLEPAQSLLMVFADFL